MERNDRQKVQLMLWAFSFFSSRPHHHSAFSFSILSPTLSSRQRRRVIGADINDKLMPFENKSQQDKDKGKKKTQKRFMVNLHSRSKERTFTLWCMSKTSSLSRLAGECLVMPAVPCPTLLNSLRKSPCEPRHATLGDR